MIGFEKKLKNWKLFLYCRKNVESETFECKYYTIHTRKLKLIAGKGGPAFVRWDSSLDHLVLDNQQCFILALKNDGFDIKFKTNSR